MYDIAIVGAGINGCASAYELKKANQKIIIFDMLGIAGGGSGAAGAFVSPKFSKAGELKELLHSAFLYSMDFYEKKFHKFFTKTQLLHIAKDEKDIQTLKHFKQNTKIPLFSLSNKELNILNSSIKENEYISLSSGIVNAKDMCQALCSGVDIKKEEIVKLKFQDSYWLLNDTTKAKKIILATGAYKKLLDESYINLRGVWGHRIDIKTTTQNNFSIHQNVSISPTKNNILAIGATHNVHYHPQTSQEPYDIEDGRKELLEKASKTLQLENIKILKDYMGLRSGSFDYIPIVGLLVNSKKTLENKKINFKVKKANYKEYTYYKNLYMINGSGGYGFVLAPYLAKILAEHILDNKEIDIKLQPARFFARWSKKLNKEK